MLKRILKGSPQSGINDIPAEDLEAAKKIIEVLKVKYGVKLLAFDFDETLVDVSAMPYAEDANDLATNHFRTCFRSIMSKALDSDLACCVVTFNCDREMIRKTVEKALPNKQDSKKVLVVTSEWSNDGQRDAMRRYGKQQHIQLVKDEYLKSCGHELLPLEIFLFDDNEINIRRATASGHHCYHVNKSVSSAQILEFVQKYSDLADQREKAASAAAAASKANVQLAAATVAPPKDASSSHLDSRQNLQLNQPIHLPIQSQVFMPQYPNQYPQTYPQPYAGSSTSQHLYSASFSDVLNFQIASNAMN